MSDRVHKFKRTVESVAAFHDAIFKAHQALAVMKVTIPEEALNLREQMRLVTSLLYTDRPGHGAGQDGTAFDMTAALLDYASDLPGH